jgi:hypothetical protein
MQILQIGSRALDAISDSLSPAPGATSRQIRINGAICVGLGFLMMIIGGGILFFLPPQWSAKVAVLPILLVYGLWLIGGYRLAFGGNPKSKAGLLDSIIRVTFGIVFIIAMAGLLIGVIALAEFIAKHI